MTNQRLSLKEVEDLKRILSRLKRLSKSNQNNEGDTRIGVYSNRFNSNWDYKTVEEISNKIRIFHQEDIYSLEQILK